MIVEKIATPVVKNKFWVVEEQGRRVATIQAREDGSIVYVHDEEREYFPSVNVLKKKYNIKFGSTTKSKKTTSDEVYGYPVTGKSYNQVYDVVRKLPVYSKSPKSKSLHCAGYYLIKFNDTWTASYCPKNITLNRYKFLGPFRTEKEINETQKRINHATD
jgi:hypothetical protein